MASISAAGTPASTSRNAPATELCVNRQDGNGLIDSGSYFTRAGQRRERRIRVGSGCDG